MSRRIGPATRLPSSLPLIARWYGGAQCRDPDGRQRRIIPRLFNSMNRKHSCLVHAFLYLWGLLALLLTVSYPAYSARELYEYTQQTDKSAGLGVLGFLMIVCVLVAGMTLVDAVLFVWNISWNIVAKMLFVLGLVAGLPFILFMGGLPLGNGDLWGYWFFYGLFSFLMLLHLTTIIIVARR